MGVLESEGNTFSVNDINLACQYVLKTYSMIAQTLIGDNRSSDGFGPHQNSSIIQKTREKPHGVGFICLLALTENAEKKPHSLPWTFREQPLYPIRLNIPTFMHLIVKHSNHVIKVRTTPLLGSSGPVEQLVVNLFKDRNTFTKA